MMSCTESSDSNGAGDYINPGFTAKVISSAKAYKIAGNSNNGSACQSIAYSGKVNNTRYAGFAAKNGTSFNFKIYWPASAITFGSQTISGCTIKLNAQPPLTNQTITVTITDETDGTYTLTFNSDISIGTYTIDGTSGAPDYVRGQVY